MMIKKQVKAVKKTASDVSKRRLLFKDLLHKKQ